MKQAIWLNQYHRFIAKASALFISFFTVLACASTNSGTHEVDAPKPAVIELRVKSAAHRLRITNELPVNIPTIIVLKNRSESTQEIRFNTSQRYDLLVRTDSEKIIYQWSEGRMFTQAQGNLVLKPGEEKEFREVLQLDPLSMSQNAGRLLIEAKLTSSNVPISATANIEVESINKLK